MENLFDKLVSTFSVTSCEKEVRDIIKSELKDLDCEIKEDKLGNLIVKIGQGPKKIMVSTHMDSVGFMTTFIEDNGFVRVGAIGDCDYKNSIGKIIKFQTGAKGRLCQEKENPDENDLYVDMFTSNREETLEKIKEGNVAGFTGHVLEENNKVISPNLHKASCYVLCEAIKSVKNFNNEYYFVFSTQGELKGRGARAAAFDIKPDYCIVLDTINAGDAKGEGQDGRIKLSNGPVISIMDAGMIIDEDLKKLLDEKAQKANINIQYSITRNHNESSNIHREVGGIRTASVEIPCRYKYSSLEVMDINDIKNTIKLISEVIK